MMSQVQVKALQQMPGRHILITHSCFNSVTCSQLVLSPPLTHLTILFACSYSCPWLLLTQGHILSVSLSCVLSVLVPYFSDAHFLCQFSDSVFCLHL